MAEVKPSGDPSTVEPDGSNLPRLWWHGSEQQHADDLGPDISRRAASTAEANQLTSRKGLPHRTFRLGQPVQIHRLNSAVLH